MIINTEDISKTQSQTRSRKGIGGPKTPEGKRRCSLNALKHGFEAKSPQALEMIDSQFDVDIKLIIGKLTLGFRPTNQQQHEIIRRMALYTARVGRANGMLQRLKAKNPDISPFAPACVKLQRHIERNEQHFKNARAVLIRQRKKSSN